MAKRVKTRFCVFNDSRGDGEALRLAPTHAATASVHGRGWSNGVFAVTTDPVCRWRRRRWHLSMGSRTTAAVDEETP